MKQIISKTKSLKERLKKSKDGKTLVSNFGYMFVLQICGYIFPLVTIPYLARVIGVDGFGKIAFAAAIVLWFQTISDWGFDYTATRDVAKNRDDPVKVSEIFSNVLWARIGLMLISFLALLGLTELIPSLKENQTIILLTFLLIPGHIMLPVWFFQAIEKMGFITIFSLIIKTFFMVMVFVLVKEKEDYLLQPVITASGYLITGLAAMYIILFKWKIKLHKPNLKNIFYMIRNSTDVFMTNVLPNLYYGFSTVLVGFFGGINSTGLLDAGRKFVSVGQQFLEVLSRVFYPFLARRISKHNLYAKLNLSVAIILCAVLFLGAPYIIHFFFTPEFAHATIVLKISAFSLIFLSLRNIYGVNYLILNGYEKTIRNITFITSVIGFVIAFPLVFYFDFIGAAITAVFVHCLQGLTMRYFAIKTMKA